MNQVTFRSIEQFDREQWNPLWAGYLEFYKVDISAEQTELSWQRFFDDTYNLQGYVVEVDGVIAGFAHCSFTNSTWLNQPDLYLEDLFVSPNFRRRGLGKFLIESCAAIAKASGSRRLYWQTQRSNESAQKLYNKISKLSENIIFEKVF